MVKRVARRVSRRKHLLVASLALAISGVLFGVSQATAGGLPVPEVDKAKAELGKRLFFDKRLSGDAAISCSTCHIPENGFSHPDAFIIQFPREGAFETMPVVTKPLFRHGDEAHPTTIWYCNADSIEAEVAPRNHDIRCQWPG